MVSDELKEPCAVPVLSPGPQATKPPRKSAARPRKAKPSPAKAAQVKLGALVRALHTLGVYDKLRLPLSQIEQEIKG